MSLRKWYGGLSTEPEAFRNPRRRSAEARAKRHGSVIITYVAERFGMTPLELRSRGNYADLTTARHIAMFLVRELQRLSLPDIGWMFGGWHHTTVLHALRKIERERQVDADLERFLNEARGALGIAALRRIPEAMEEGK